MLSTGGEGWRGGEGGDCLGGEEGDWLEEKGGVLVGRGGGGLHGRGGGEGMCEWHGVQELSR